MNDEEKKAAKAATAEAAKVVKAKATEYVMVAESVELDAAHFLRQASRLVGLDGAMTRSAALAASAHLLAAHVLMDEGEA